MKRLSQIQMDRARHNRAKVTEQDVREMRALRKAGMTYKAIGEKFGLGINATFKASNGYSWQHVV